MTRRAVSIVLAALLTGCLASGPTQTPEIKAANEESNAIRRECLQRHESGEWTLTQAVECANPRILEKFEAANYPYMDLMRLIMAARLAGAQKVDRGELTEDELKRQLDVFRSRLTEEMWRRDDEATRAAAQSASVPPSPETVDPATKAKLLDGLSAFDALMS